MGLFRRMTLPASSLKISEIIPKYDIKMHRVMEIGKALYQGYLPNKLLVEDFAYLQGFHDYKVYTSGNRLGLKKRRKTLQIPKFTTEYLAKLIYTEKVVMNTISENETVRNNIHEYLLEVLKDNDYWTNTSGLSEVMFNIGGAVEKPTIKNNVIKIEFIDGTQFDATEYDASGINSGVFTSVFVKDGYYFTKLTKYTVKDNSYIIEKELYKAKSPDMIGDKVKYEDYFDDVRIFTLNNFKSIPFTYKKPRIKNNQVIDSPYGIPIWFNAIDTVGDIDLIFDRKNTEVKWGGRTKVVPAYALKKHIDPTTKEATNFADPDDPTILGLDLDPENTSTKPVDLTSDIRQEPFIQLLNQGLDLYGFQTGFSPGTFTSDGKSIQTATQVITEKMATNQTKVNQEQGLLEQHKNLFMSIVELAHAFKLDSRVSIIPDDLDFDVIFDDSVIIDKEKKLTDMKQDANDGYLPKYMYVMEKYKVDEDTAKELIAEAAKEDSLAGLLTVETIEVDEV